MNQTKARIFLSLFMLLLFQYRYNLENPKQIVFVWLGYTIVCEFLLLLFFNSKHSFKLGGVFAFKTIAILLLNTTTLRTHSIAYF